MRYSALMMEQTFLRFVILSSDSEQQVGHDERPMLINLAHIVSIRPINIVTDNDLIKGFWIRTSNGKKYRAASIPPQLEALFDSPDIGRGRPRGKKLASNVVSQ